MQDAVEEIREGAGDDEITDVSISCDGTWQKRGFTSLNGAVVIISTVTGKVLDVEVMSRYCNACVMHEKLKLTDPAKYEQYKLSHECLSKNESRTINGRRQSTISKKMRRRYNRAAKKHKSDKTKSKEGKVYGAGAF